MAGGGRKPSPDIEEMEDIISQGGACGGTTFSVPVPTALTSLISNGSAGHGLRDIRDADMELFLIHNWTTPLTVTSHAVHRTLSVDNDIFTRSHNNSPWKEQGNIAFICNGGKIVRAHGLLLNAILPRFVTELMDIQTFVVNPTYNTSPHIPVFVKGIEAKCVEHFLTLSNKSVAFMTGREVLQMKRMIEVLNIHELAVFVCPPIGGINGGTYAGNGVLGASAVAPAVAGPSSAQNFGASAAGTSDDGRWCKIKMGPPAEHKKIPPPPPFQRKPRVKSKSSSDKKSSQDSAAKGYDKPKKMPRELFTEELRDSVVSAFNSGATLRGVARQFNIHPSTVWRWKNNVKAPGPDSDTRAAVQNQMTSGGGEGGPNSVEMDEVVGASALDISTVNCPGTAEMDVGVDSFVQTEGQLGTVPPVVPVTVETPTIGFDSVLMDNPFIGHYFDGGLSSLYTQAMDHSDLITLNNMTMAIQTPPSSPPRDQNDNGIREEENDRGKENVFYQL